MKNKVVVLSGAGISAESGIKTFRDAGGLWEGHDVMEVASPDGWYRNPSLVLDFYNKRRQQLLTVSPNPGHTALAQVEEYFETTIVTQNVDDLHERAGSSHVIHLHGELLKVRPINDPNQVLDWKEDLTLGDTCPDGIQLRPHIVWFGEAVPMMDAAISEVASCDTLIVVGTSLQVYPAAGLISYAPRHVEIYYIDPAPNVSYELSQVDNLNIISEKASIGLPKLVSDLISQRGQIGV